MKKYNVVLLGGSNSVMVNGLQKGLRKENVNLTNLALGGSSSLQNLYELKRKRNQEYLENADLIISESNINDRAAAFDVVLKHTDWLYSELASMNKKILIILMPHILFKKNKGCNNIHKFHIAKYGFNIIDLQEYYERFNLCDFFHNIDESHQMGFVMAQLAKNIINNISYFLYPKKIYDKRFFFKICFPSEMLSNGDQFIQNNTLYEKYRTKSTMKFSNSFFSETVFRIDKSSILKFPKSLDGYTLIGVHSWNSGLIKMNKNWEINHKLTSTIIIKNNQAVVKITQPYMNAFRDTEINIDDNTSVYFDTSNLSVIKLNNKIYRLEHFDIISFFLISNISHNVKINLKKINNIDIKIPKQYNCDFLIPPIEKYKKVIEEYCLIMDPRKINLIQEMLNKEVKEKKVMQENILKIQQNFLREKNQLQNDNNELFLKYIKIYNKIHSAKIRIQNQLSYKLGQAMIVNSKSMLGYIRMPFVLSYIYDKHKQEQKIYQEKIKKDSSLILPPLESYPDYKEALKEKECFTYKLGQELIKANKNWYGGGVYQVVA
ncbi:hypothetical protein [Campylobacter coli]|uniref:hypothetical protein n=1 Tax=Campylobacter coli TaxID=195 RepID=UPI0020C655C5|nr:hypothetical protein [Campylobacter coli]